MRRLLTFLTVLLVLAGLAIVSTSPAHAGEEKVKRLSVRYDVQADGSIDVRYELDWDFGEKGRRGIEFDIVTREQWTPDPANASAEEQDKDALYVIDDPVVTSPSGAPTQYELSEYDYGSDGSVTLRIGDPERQLDKSRHTYVIEYNMRGGLRTFDDVPELHLDVTGRGYPPIEDFDVTVTAPDGVTKARCLAGYDECEAKVEGGEAKLRGRKPEGTITAVAALEPGSVDNAEPILEDRRLSHPELQREETTHVVDAQGLVHTDSTLVYRLPKQPDDEHSISLDLPARRRFDQERDQVYRYRDVEVEVSDATMDTPTEAPTVSDYHRNKSWQEATSRIRFTTDAPEVTIRVRYVLEGAVVVDGATAALHLRGSVSDHHTPAFRYSWQLPTDPADVALWSRYGSTDDNAISYLEPQVSGTTVSLAQGDFSGSNAWAAITFPASSLKGVPPSLEPSIDFASEQHLEAGWLGGGGGLVGMLLVGLVGRRYTKPRDWRFANTPPGVEGASHEVTRAQRHGPVPVRFEPPEHVDLGTAALVWDRGHHSRHIAAGIVALAAEDRIELRLGSGSQTHHVRKRGRTYMDSSLEDRVFRHLPENGPINEQKLQTLASMLASEARADVVLGGLFSRAGGGWGPRKILMVTLGVIVPAVAWFVYLASMEGGFIPLPPALSGNILIPFGITVGSWIGFGIVLSHPEPPGLSAKGTMVREQMEGFKQYLETAESHQLQFEEGEDIFRKYLPWAVLFGIADRWANACATMAARGDIPSPDTSFTGGVSITRFASDVDSLAAHVTASSSSSSSSSGWSSDGSSGGSSGFSSSSSGGSGGGGTGASSW